MKTTAIKKSNKKTVQVLERHAIDKLDADGKRIDVVCYLVLSSNGKDEYCTTFRNGCLVGCTCPGSSDWLRGCYHGKQLAEREREIRETRRSNYELQFIA